MTNCDNCPLRLYNTKVHNISPVGNRWTGKCIVVPNVDYPAYKNKDMAFSSQVEIIAEALSFSTGELESNLYLVPLIRCNESIGCKVNEDIYKRCLEYFLEDLKIYNFRHILLLGTSVQRILNLPINEARTTVYRSKNERFYSSSYSPLIKLVNTNLYNDFVKDVINWYNSAINNKYNN